MEKLEGRIRNHDREIEKMCNHHFQGFVDSITELLKVRGEAQKLKVQKQRKSRSTKGVIWTDLNLLCVYMSGEIPNIYSYCIWFFALLCLFQGQVTETNQKLQNDGKEVIGLVFDSEHVTVKIMFILILSIIKMNGYILCSSWHQWMSWGSAVCSKETSPPPLTNSHTAYQVQTLSLWAFFFLSDITKLY